MRAGLAGRGVDQDDDVSRGRRLRGIRRRHKRQGEVGLTVRSRVPQNIDGLHRRRLHHRRGGHQDQGCHERPQGQSASQPHAETPEFKGETISMCHRFQIWDRARCLRNVNRTGWPAGRPAPNGPEISPAIVTRFSEGREEKSVTLSTFPAIPRSTRHRARAPRAIVVFGPRVMRVVTTPCALCRLPPLNRLVGFYGFWDTLPAPSRRTHRRRGNLPHVPFEAVFGDLLVQRVAIDSQPRRGLRLHPVARMEHLPDHLSLHQ